MRFDSPNLKITADRLGDIFKGGNFAGNFHRVCDTIYRNTIGCEFWRQAYIQKTTTYVV